MAIFRPSSIVGAISGNLGSVNFGNARFGPFIRRRAYPSPDRGAPRCANRATYASASPAWRALTAAQRIAWRSAAVSFNHTNRLGVSSPLSGWQLYLKYYIYAAHFFFPAPTVPPVLITQTPPDSSALDLHSGGGSEITVERPASADVITWELQLSRPWSIFADRPSKCWSFVHGDINFSVAIDIDDELAAVFAPLEAREIFWARVRCAQVDTLPSPWLVSSATVA